MPAKQPAAPSNAMAEIGRLRKGRDAKIMTDVPIVDEFSVESLERDPFPIYEWLRREAPVCYIPAVDLWFITRWSDVMAAGQDAIRFPAAMPNSPLDRTLGGRSVLTVDGVDHQRMRAPMEGKLRPRSLENNALAAVTRIADHLLSKIAPSGQAELMATFCEPLAVLSLAEVIGLRGIDAGTLRRWFHEIAAGTANYEANPTKQRVADDTSAEVDRALRPLLEDQLAHPDGTMVSDMLHAVTGDLTERMRAIMPTLKLALIGGLQEPGHGLATTIVGLLSDSRQLAAIRADPDGMIRRAVDEGIRWISPIGTQGRVAGSGACVRGVEIPVGAKVGLMVQSANRDKDVWGSSADLFDVFRPVRANAVFGFGSHNCVGQHLAKIQMRTGLCRVLARLPGLQLDTERPPRFFGWEYRGPTELHVRWDVRD